MERQLACYILDTIAEKELSQSKTAKLAGIDKGNLNKCIKGVQLFTLDVVEKLIAAIGLDRKTAYELYSEEVFREDVNKVKAKRKELLKRCIEHGFSELAERIASAMLEEGSTAIGFYQMAEEYRMAGKEDEAIGLYDKAISLETNRYSELLALCLYRKFSILRLRDFKLYDICLEFSFHIENLPFFSEEDQEIKLEAYRQLITSYYVMDDYRAVFKYCDELAKLALLETCKDKRLGKKYHGYALVYKGFAARATGQYGLALDLIDLYKDNDTDEFASWATYNRLVVQIEMGQIEKIPDMLAYIRQNPMNNAGIILALNTYLRYNRVEEATGMIREHQEQIDLLLKNNDKLYQKWVCDLHLSLSVLNRLTGDDDKAKSHLLDAMRSTISLKQQKQWYECIKEYNDHHIMKNMDHSDYFKLLADSARLFEKGE